ncbi:MAG: LPS-assembly protein LptD [Pseudobdellovibrionaceae bacterium]
MIRLLVLLLSLLLTATAWAQRSGELSAVIQGITIQADSMDRDTENETVDLVGNVQVIYQDQHMTCEKARINLRAKSLDATGNVLITSPKANLAGQRIIMDYETNTGVILNGYVQSGNVLFEGSQIHKLSEVDYVADDARYTTCTTCPEAWSFSGTKIRAEIGGYAYIKNSTMKFAGVPVFWLPYLAVPLKTDRQSGLLTPTIGQRGLGGLTYSQSYFWAMSRSQDSTWNFTNYEFRGPKGLLNYRYALTESSEGEMDFGILKDRVFSDDQRLNTFRPPDARGDSIQRYFLRYNHYYDMPDGFTQRVQLNTASDLQYPADFPLETLNNGDPAMESRLSVTKNSDYYHWGLDSSLYTSLMQSNPLGGNEFAVHRLPELRFSQTQRKIGNSEFLGSFDFQYVNFARAGGAFDNMDSPYDPTGDTKRQVDHTNSAKCNNPQDPFAWEKDPDCKPVYDGKFNSGTDLIRTGQRFEFRPSIIRPMKFQNLEVFPRLTYRETHYVFPDVLPKGMDTHNTRRYFRADLSARTTLSRIYGDFSSLQSERIKHEIQPEVTATTIPWIYHPQHEFFGEDNQENVPYESNPALNDAVINGPAGLQFDYFDRLDNRKVITFGLTNKLTQKFWEYGSPVYLQFLFWRISQSYDVYQAERNPNARPLSELVSDLNINLRYLQIYQNAKYKPYQKVTDTSSRVRILNSKNDFFQVKYDVTYPPGSEGEADIVGRTEGYVISARKGVSFFDFIGKLNYGIRPQNALLAWGYGAQIRLPGDCLYIGLTHFKPVDKKPEIELGVNFAWDGSARPQLDESILTAFGF